MGKNKSAEHRNPSPIIPIVHQRIAHVACTPPPPPSPAPPRALPLAHRIVIAGDGRAGRHAQAQGRARAIPATVALVVAAVRGRAQQAPALGVGARVRRLVVGRRGVAQVGEKQLARVGRRPRRRRQQRRPRRAAAAAARCGRRRAFAWVVAGVPRVRQRQLRQRYVGGAALRAGRHGLRAGEAGLRGGGPRVPEAERRVGAGGGVAGRCGVAAAFEQDAALLGAVGGWWCEGAGHRGQAPFFDVRFDEHEAQLAEVDVHLAGPVGTYCGEEVVRLEAVGYVFEFLAVTCEEDGSGAWSVANTDNIALLVFWSV